MKARTHNWSRKWYNFPEIPKSLLHHRRAEAASDGHQQLPGRDSRAAARRLGQEEPAEHERHHGAEAQEADATGGHGEAEEGEGQTQGESRSEEAGSDS